MPRIIITPTTLKAAKSYDRPNGVRQPVMIPNPVGVLALASVNGRGSYAKFKRSNPASSKAIAAAAKKIAKQEGLSFFEAIKAARGQAARMPGMAPGKAIAAARKTSVRRKAAGKKVHKIGSGEAFENQVAAIMRRGLSEKAAKAIAASAGRKAYGKTYYQSLATAGKRRAKRLRSNPQETQMLANFTKAHNARAARAMRMAVSKGISLKAAWKVVKGGKASASTAPKRKKAAPKASRKKARSPAQKAATKKMLAKHKWAWERKKPRGRGMKSYRVFTKKTGRTKGHHVRNVTKGGVLGSGTLMIGAGRKRKTKHFTKFVSFGPQAGKGKRMRVYWKNASAAAMADLGGQHGASTHRKAPTGPKARNPRPSVTGIGSDPSQETMVDVGGTYALRAETDPAKRRKLAAKMGKGKYSSSWTTMYQKVPYRFPNKLGGFVVRQTRSGRPLFVDKHGNHMTRGQWNEDPIPGYSDMFPDDPHVIKRGEALKVARDVARAAAKKRAAMYGTTLQKKVAKLEADKANLEAKLAGLNPAEIDRLIDEGKYMYSPNKRGNGRKRGKGKTRRTNRRRSHRVRRVSLRKMQARMRGLMRRNKHKRRSRRRVRVIHMSANRRRSRSRRHGRGIFGRNRRHRRSYRRNGMEMYSPAVTSALYVFGGFAVHKILRGLVAGLIGTMLPDSVKPYGTLLSGLLVAGVGVPAAAKVIPAHAVEVGAGMVTSFLHDLFMVLSASFAPQAAHYLSGYGAIPMMNTTGYSGYGYLSERGMGVDPYAQAAAGYGSYDVISSQYRGYGVAGYSQAAAGYGEYEPVSGTLDGLHGDNASIEAALNAADMPEQAAAGYGDAPVMQAMAGSGIQAVNTWIPNDPSLAISGFGGVF